MLLVPLRASFLSCFILLGCPAPGAILVTRLVCGWRRSGQAWSSRRRTPGSLLTLVLRPTPHNNSSHITFTTRNLSSKINLHRFFQTWEQCSDMVLSASVGESEYSIDIRHLKSLVQYWWLAGTNIIVGCAARQARWSLLLFVGSQHILIQT